MSLNLDDILEQDELNDPFEKNCESIEDIKKLYLKAGKRFFVDTESEGEIEICSLIIKLFIALLSPPIK